MEDSKNPQNLRFAKYSMISLVIAVIIFLLTVIVTRAPNFLLGNRQIFYEIIIPFFLVVSIIFGMLSLLLYFTEENKRIISLVISVISTISSVIWSIKILIGMMTILF